MSGMGLKLMVNTMDMGNCWGGEDVGGGLEDGTVGGMLGGGFTRAGNFVEECPFRISPSFFFCFFKTYDRFLVP